MLSGSSRRPVDPIHHFGSSPDDDAERRYAMAKVGRNDPCRCGSGAKAKRCCLADPLLAVASPRAVLARLKPVVAVDLAGIDREWFNEIYEEVLALPELDVSLHLRLPGILTPEIEEAMFSYTDKDEDVFEEALHAVVATLGTFERRLELGEAVLRLRDHGVVPPEVAAVAIFDLNEEGSQLLLSSLAQAIAVKSGAEATPSGLILAS
jgi:hypothetical protein